MSHPGTEALIRRYYDAFNKGDADGMLACLSNDIIHDVNQGVRRPGKQAFRIFCDHMRRCYAEQLDGIVIMTSADGKRAAAEFNVKGTYLTTDVGLPPANGQKYALPGGSFFAVDAGKISRVTTYYNLTDWLMQVGGSDK